jgi:hypothetical protein
MGAWGRGVFENDDAMDWTVAFLEGSSVDALQDALDDALDSEDYLDSDQGSYALAAAELLAAATGRPCRDLPSGLGEWATANPQIATPSLLARARDAVDRVIGEDESELAELWAESDEFEDWLEEMEELKDRLS